MGGELPPAVGDLPVGATVAGYQVDRLIGRGGMASVYRAKDVRLDRQVALKILAPELARDQAFRQRFIRESRAAASVDHPNIIPVFEAGESDGMLFIAMRYVTGQDVRALIEREGRLPPARVVSIATQVASALDAAHALGLIHRDVKPANMLLASVGTATRPDHVYLSDFGLSKVSVAAQSLTGTGQFLGTIDYMSPEQIEGRTVDGRTDLYALGCAAFEMLTGQPPFRREQNLAVMWAQMSAAPPSVSSLRPDLPPQVDQVIARALAKAPDSRQSSCMEFATELRTACEAAFAGASAGSPSEPDAWHPPTAAIGLPAAMAGSPGTVPPGAVPPGTGAPGTGAPGTVPPGAAAAGRYEETITEGAPGAGAGQGPGHSGPGQYGSGPGQYGPGQYGPGQVQTGPGQVQYGSGPGQLGGPSGPGAGAGKTDALWSGQSGAPSTYPGQAPPPRGRGKVVPVLVGLLVVLILAGAGYAVLHLRGNTTPQASVSSPPKTTTSTTSTTPATSPATRPARTPNQVVTAYYNAVNNHNYRKAWRLNYHVHSFQTYQQFKAGFAGTSHTTLTIVSVSGNTVSMRLTATQTDGTVKYYQGTYTVQNGTIVDSAVQQTG